MIFQELNRLCFIIRIILRYGLIEFIPINRLVFPFKKGNKFILQIYNKYPKYSLGKRLRLALQELGPIWIKFGQMLSTRRDIFSYSISNQLEMLQDRVKPFDGDLAKICIENAIGNNLEIWFEDFQKKPLASASISQVHSAKLKKNKKEVIIKVIRPGILSIIKIDINLMHRLSNWVYILFLKKQKFQFSNIISEYEKILFNELNLLKETANAIQLRRNFKSSNLLYIPKIYVNFCSKNVIVMERIYGIPIYNINELKNHGIDMKLLAKRGIEIFFTQVFRDNFFHGDLHPGNIFVNYQQPDNPQYIIIDYGIIGSLSKKDTYYLAANFIAFFNRNYRKIAELHLNSGWIPTDTNIEDFECSIRTVFEPIFEQPLEEIPFSKILLNLFSIIQNFNMDIQPQLILLQKTLLYIEGIIRQLYPGINLWQSSKPFLETWMKEQLKLSKIFYSLKDNMPYWIDIIPELPNLLCQELKNSNILQKKTEILIKNLYEHNVNNIRSLFLFGIGSIFVINSIFWILQENKIIKFFGIFEFGLGIFFWIMGWKYIN